MSIFDYVDKSAPVLVVDDFATMRRIVKTVLKQIGFENIDEAPDGKEALAKLKSQPCQLVISDWNMPQMMGIDLLRAVREDPQLKSLPFIMVTAETNKDNVIEAAKAGVSNYVIKPFTADMLETKMVDVFKKIAAKP